MADDLDDLLRRAMKTLDDQVPSGYFEGLPNRTLARLEDDSMQTTGTSMSANESSASGVPPQERDEDSGLHDIRSMASSTKMRLSSRRVATSPPVDEDILASSSAGWKAVALPEPAKMVSLPALTELPPAAEVKKAERTSASQVAKAAVAIESRPVAAAPVAATSVATSVEAPAPIVGARLAKAPASPASKTGLYAALGLGLAAAAGVAFFVLNQQKEKPAAPAEQVAVAPAPAPAQVTATPLEPAPPPPPAPEPAPAPVEVAAAAPADEPEVEEKAPSKERKRVAKDADDSKGEDKPAKASPKEPVKAVEAKKPAPATGEASGEPSFDQLLKEAGVQDSKPAAPKLAKKSLSGGDIKNGMGGVAGKAQACYAGTQGTAKVKLTVTPDGKVEKVTTSGAFAGTPVGACIEAAVKSATFPPWDGGPQTFGYSYLLAE